MNNPESSPAFRLDGFLKYVGVVATGGEAKLRIQGGEVKLNGETETRRRKQLSFGDEVEIDGESFCVELAPEDSHSNTADPVGNSTDPTDNADAAAAPPSGQDGVETAPNPRL